MSSRDRIFEQIKKEMLTNIENATLETLDQSFQLNQQLFIYANNLNEIPNYLEPEENVPKLKDIIVTQDNKSEKDKTKEIKEEKTNEKSIIEEQPANSGIFHQNIIHGYIESQDQGKIFIPESKIRKNHFKQGDLVEFTPYTQSDNDKTFYNYKLLKKSNPIETNRQTFIGGIVEIDSYDNSFVVKENTDGQTLISAQGTFSTYVLPTETIEHFQIEDGSIVDLAWDRTDVYNTIRVTWRH